MTNPRLSHDYSIYSSAIGGILGIILVEWYSAVQ